MGSCTSRDYQKDFKSLQTLFIQTRYKSVSRFANKIMFNIVIPEKYEYVCDDVVTYFRSNGWIIQYLRYKTYSVTIEKL